ncbi:MAG: RHS repeat-associated core domain-containing protein [Ferruginibacter sp.]
MKLIKHSAFLLLLLFVGHKSICQTKQPIQYAPWEHPIIQGLQQKVNYLTPIERQTEGDYFVPLAILNNRTHKIYFITTFGHIFDSIPLSTSLFNAFLNKQVDPYKFCATEVPQQCLKQIADLRQILRQKGKEANKYLPKTAFIQMDDIKAAPTSFQKMIILDKYFSDMTRLSMLLNMNVSEIRDSIYTKKTFNYQFANDLGKMEIHDRKDYPNVVYSNTDIYSQFSKAILIPSTGKLYIHDWYHEKPIDSVQLKMDKLKDLVHDKADVFAIYRNWLELSYQTANDYTDKLLGKKIPIAAKEGDQQLYYQLQQAKINLTCKILNCSLPDYDILFYNTKKDCEKYGRRKWITKTGWQDIPPPPPSGMHTVTRGNTHYFLYDHRGNVMATVSDRKIQHSSDGVTVDYYIPDVVTATDYSSFGSELPGRTYSNGTKVAENYNGKRKDDETGYLDYGMRMYDPRIARFISVDPITKSFPMLTPYQFASNTPIQAIDLDGLEAFLITSRTDADGKAFLEVSISDMNAPFSVTNVDGKSTNYFPYQSMQMALGNSIVSQGSLLVPVNQNGDYKTYSASPIGGKGGEPVNEVFNMLFDNFKLTPTINISEIVPSTPVSVNLNKEANAPINKNPTSSVTTPPITSVTEPTIALNYTDRAGLPNDFIVTDNNSGKDVIKKLGGSTTPMGGIIPNSGSTIQTAPAAMKGGTMTLTVTNQTTRSGDSYSATLTITPTVKRNSTIPDPATFGNQPKIKQGQSKSLDNNQALDNKSTVNPSKH